MYCIKKQGWQPPQEQCFDRSLLRGSDCGIVNRLIVSLAQRKTTDEKLAGLGFYHNRIIHSAKKCILMRKHEVSKMRGIVHWRSSVSNACSPGILFRLPALVDIQAAMS